MGNCANNPCGCDGQLEQTNEAHVQGNAQSEGGLLSHRNNLSVNKRPIQIKSNQKTLQSDRQRNEDDVNNKENMQNQSQGSTTINDSKSSNKLQIQLPQAKTSQLKQSYVNVNLENGNNSLEEISNKGQSNSQQNQQPKFKRITNNPNSIHPTVKQLLQQFGNFDYDSNESYDENLQEGPLMYENGAVYYGELQNNMRHGRGKQIWKDGSFYEGYWQKDTAWGKGRLIHSDGDVYFGDWQCDRAHGKGTYYHGDGAKYQGNWFEDRQHGQGIETWPDGTSYEGQYEHGKKHGIGLFKWADGSFYKGEFGNNEIEGQGIYKWNDGREFEGQWHYNKMEGRGIFKWPDGRQYEGQYIDDKKEGFGIFTWPDGKIYRGNWKDGKQHGYGVIQFSDGQEREGCWLQGKYAGNDISSDQQIKAQAAQYKSIIAQIQKESQMHKQSQQNNQI